MGEITITQQNASALLAKDNLIQLSFIYSYKNRKYWKLLKPLKCQLSNGQTVIIPEGFVTDLSSVPQILWGIFHPFGDFLLAALIHDYLYINKPFSRFFADKEMLIWSKVLNENNVDNYIRYGAVRAFGWTWWKNVFKF